MKRGIRYTGIPLWWNSLGQSWSGQCQEGLEQMKIRLFLYVFIAIMCTLTTLTSEIAQRKFQKMHYRSMLQFPASAPGRWAGRRRDINLVFNPIFYTIDRVSCLSWWGFFVRNQNNSTLLKGPSSPGAPSAPYLLPCCPPPKAPVQLQELLLAKWFEPKWVPLYSSTNEW